MSDLSAKVREDYGMKFRHKSEAAEIANYIELMQATITELTARVKYLEIEWTHPDKENQKWDANEANERLSRIQPLKEKDRD